MTTETAEQKHLTKTGNYFIANYPPFSFWSDGQVGELKAALDREPRPDTPLGLYVHIPFCRQRCHFCYFRVYTGKDASAPKVKAYAQELIHELSLYASLPIIGGRKPKYIYFGGGTPSYLSAEQLTQLTDEMKRLLPWDEAEEVAFECEPGTLNEKKLRAIRDIGVTRLSLGVENFSDEVLELNNRAHKSKEIRRAYEYAREIGFPQINIDLIAGMMGETPENWRACIAQALELAPECVTIYQMEIPYNTTIHREITKGGTLDAPVADWETKREWVRYAFEEFERAGYTVTSGYTVVKDPDAVKFVYRDRLWTGADMISLGTASFGHISGVHYQNEKDYSPYLASVQANELPIRRAFKLNDEELLIRELILQFKLGRVRPSYFQKKFGVDVAERFAEPLSDLQQRGILHAGEDALELTREGLLQVDGLLSAFFLPRHLSERYT